MVRPQKIVALIAAIGAFGACTVMCDMDPKPQGRVNDYANVIDPEYREKIEAVISEVDLKTSAEIAVVAADSIAPHDEISYARLIFDNWKIGKKGKDNGVLILVAVKERRWRIETGYGLEGILPDGRCGEIGRAYMVPLLKEGKYGEALYRGVAAVAGTIAADAHVALDTLGGKTLPAPAGTTASDDTALPILYAVVPVFFFIWNLPWPVYIGLPFTLIFALAFTAFSPLMPVLIIGAYLASMAFRFLYWRKLPRAKRGSIFSAQTYGGRFTTSSGGWSSGGGGFGGGFGGGGGGGGGSGGGF